MNHSIMITVNGFSFMAEADVVHAPGGRIIDSVTAPNPPLQVLSDLADTLADIHDVLYVISHHLTDTARTHHAIEFGAIGIEFHALDPQALRADLAGKTFMIKLKDSAGTTRLFDVGATDSSTAYYVAADQVPAAILSSVVQPIGA